MPPYLQLAIDWCYRSRRKLATAGVGLLACFIAYHAMFGANGMMVYHQKKTEYRKAQKEIEELQRENERLQGQIKALKTDPATIEKEAREQLRYTRPGEVIYLLPESASQGAPPAAASARNDSAR